MLPELDWEDDAPTRVRNDGKAGAPEPTDDPRDVSGMVRIRREPEEPREDTGIRVKRNAAFDPRKTVVGLAPPPIPAVPGAPPMRVVPQMVVPQRPGAAPVAPPLPDPPPFGGREVLGAAPRGTSAVMTPLPLPPVQAEGSWAPAAQAAVVPPPPPPAAVAHAAPLHWQPQANEQPAYLRFVPPAPAAPIDPEQARQRKLRLIVLVTLAALALFAASVFATSLIAG
jgi:hypothetical protein